MKKFCTIVLLFVFSLSAIGSDEHLRALELTNKILENREGADSLEKVKELAAGENVDVRIAYERLYQAQQKIGQARATYFPYGIGEVLVLQATDFWNPLILTELVTSIPSKWFNVKRTHNLRNAEKHTLAALRENIKNEVANLYYETLKEEAIIDLARYELIMLEELMQALKVQVQTGIATQQDLDELEYSSLRKREAFLKLESYLNESKASMKMLLGLSYRDKMIKFQPVNKFLSSNDFQMNKEELVLTALNRSHEMKAAQQMIYAASNAKRSTKWSILSFAGLGFDYLQRVHLAGSKLNQAIYAKEALEVNIQNEVYSKDSRLRNSIDVMTRELSIMETSRDFMLTQLELFKAHRINVNELIDANLIYIRDFAQTIIYHYDSLQRLDDLERIALGNVTSSDVAQVKFEFKLNQHKRRNHFQMLPIENTSQSVSSVTYRFDSHDISDLKSFNPQDNFSVELGRSVKFPIVGTALIFFKNGEVIQRNFNISK